MAPACLNEVVRDHSAEEKLDSFSQIRSALKLSDEEPNQVSRTSFGSRLMVCIDRLDWALLILDTSSRMDAYRTQNVSGNWPSERDIKLGQSWSSVIHSNPVPLMKETIDPILKARFTKVRVLKLAKRANWPEDRSPHTRPSPGFGIRTRFRGLGSRRCNSDLCGDPVISIRGEPHPGSVSLRARFPPEALEVAYEPREGQASFSHWFCKALSLAICLCVYLIDCGVELKRRSVTLSILRKATIPVGRAFVRVVPSQGVPDTLPSMHSAS